MPDLAYFLWPANGAFGGVLERFLHAGHQTSQFSRVLAHDCHVMVNKIRKRDPKEGHEQQLLQLLSYRLAVLNLENTRIGRV